MKITIEWENGQKHICTMPKPNFMVDNIEKKMISKILIESGPPLSLTNEEISDIRDEFFAPNGCNIYTFARALLKKAQEND
jgi:hypothetical protein